MADTDTLKLAGRQGLDYNGYMTSYDSATFFQKLGLGIETGPTGTNVADISLVLINNPDEPHRKLAFIFGGEATVNISMPDGKNRDMAGEILILFSWPQRRCLNSPIGTSKANR